jgi:hypothetical protein
MPQQIRPGAEELLNALVKTEDRAIASARKRGCVCRKLVEGSDRTYPYARFSRNEVIGKPLDKIPWELIHEPGCPLDGQRGVG